MLCCCSGLSDCGVDISRCLFFNRTSNAEKISQTHTALAAVLPGVDFVLLSSGDTPSSYVNIRASSPAAAEDPAVKKLMTQLLPDGLAVFFILYFPPTPRNECFHFDYRAATAAATEYRKQLRSPPTASALLEERKQIKQRVEEQRQRRREAERSRGLEQSQDESDTEEEEDDEGVGQIHIGVPAIHAAADLKQINERVSQSAFIRGNHINPCRLFVALPVCAQLINQFGCGRWKFTLPLPRSPCGLVGGTTEAPEMSRKKDTL